MNEYVNGGISSAGVNYYTPPIGNTQNYYSSGNHQYALSSESENRYSSQQGQIAQMMQQANVKNNSTQQWATGLQTAGSAISLIPGWGTVVGGIVTGIGAIVGGVGKKNAQNAQVESQQQQEQLAMARQQSIKDTQFQTNRFNSLENNNLNYQFNRGLNNY